MSLCRNVSEIFEVRLEWIHSKKPKFCFDFTHKNAEILYDRENININRIQYVIKCAGWIYDFSAIHVWLFPPNSVPAQLLDYRPSSCDLVQGCPHTSLPFLLHGSMYSGIEKFLHSDVLQQKRWIKCMTVKWEESQSVWKALPLSIGHVVFAVLCKILFIKLNTEHLVPLWRKFLLTLGLQ